MNIFKKISAAIALSVSLAFPALAQFSSPSVSIISSAGVDAFAGSGIGSVLTRTTTGWKTLNCSNGQVMLFQGLGVNTTCYTPSGTGTVTSVGATVPSFMSVSGSPITAGGALGLSFNSQSANVVFASPSGSLGAPTFRALTAMDFGSYTISPYFNYLYLQNAASSATPAGYAAFFPLVNGAGMLGDSTHYFENTYTNALSLPSKTANNFFAAPSGSAGAPIWRALTQADVNLTQSGAATIKGNPTNATANITDFTVQGLADITAPNSTSDWLLIYQNSTGQFKKVNPSEIGASVSSGVSTVSNADGSLTVSPTSGAVVASVSATTKQGLNPAGTVIYFAGNSCPSGYLGADGSPINRGTYATLFGVINTTYGAGDGSTTYNLPDMRGVFARGWDNGRGLDPGRAIGTFQADAFQGHVHQENGSGTGVVGGSNAGGPSSGSNIGFSSYTGSPLSDGTNGTPRTAAETRPSNVALLGCIKY